MFTLIGIIRSIMILNLQFGRTSANHDLYYKVLSRFYIFRVHNTKKESVYKVFGFRENGIRPQPHCSKYRAVATIS